MARNQISSDRRSKRDLENGGNSGNRKGSGPSSTTSDEDGITTILTNEKQDKGTGIGGGPASSGQPGHGSSTGFEETTSEGRTGSGQSCETTAQETTLGKTVEATGNGTETRRYFSSGSHSGGSSSSSN
jgi:hypothetical protein